MERALIAERAGARPDGQEQDSPFDRIVLVGFMGSGKSTVGPLLAKSLGWRFVDADQAIQRVDGRDISRIFREDGEEGFREIESRVTAELLEDRQLVIATGGGWPCRPRRLEALPDDTLSIWLRVGPERAFERIRTHHEARPLLDADDPLGRIRVLLARREAYYRKARWSVDTEHYRPGDTVEVVIDRLRTDAERPLHA